MFCESKISYFSNGMMRYDIAHIQPAWVDMGRVVAGIREFVAST
jgi:hypothetical protein